MRSYFYPNRLIPRSYFEPTEIFPLDKVLRYSIDSGSYMFIVELKDLDYDARVFLRKVDEGILRITIEKFKGQFEENADRETYDISLGDYTVRVSFKPFRLMVTKGDRLILRECGFNGEHIPMYGFRVSSTGLGRTVKGEVWTLSLYLENDEALYGLGENFGPLNKRGQEFYCYSVDSPCTPSISTYIPIPFIWSTRGYGILLNTSAPSYFDVGHFHYGILTIVVRDEKLDYYLFLDDDPLGIIRKYYRVSGWPRLPPKWSFGFWISRCSYMNQKEVLEVARKFREKNIPCDVIHIDPPWMGVWRRLRNDVICLEWDRQEFPDPQRMINELKEMGFKLCLWINPYLEPGSKLFNEARERGLLLKRRDGSIATPDQCCQKKLGAGLLDLTMPEARVFLKDKLKELLKMGVAVFKSDYGEAAPADAVYSNGEEGEKMHNLYPLLYQSTVYEAVEEVYGVGLVWGRSGYMGIQKYPVQWGGDTYSTWQDLYTSVRGVLSYSCSGAVFSSFDIGGFIGKPDPDLYVRWLQAGLFVSHSRAHGTSPREPWEYGVEAEVIAKKFIELRYRLLPYIYSEAKYCVDVGEPLVKPLVTVHPRDPAVKNIDYEFYFGRFMLVAPVMNRECESDVYLPEGLWYDFWSDKVIRGGRWLRVEAPLNKMPIYVRAGAIVPMLDKAPNYIGEHPVGRLVVHIYEPEKAGEYAYHVYDDDFEGDILMQYDDTALKARAKFTKKINVRFIFHTRKRLD